MTILIDNFFMETDEWLLVSDLVYFSVDVVDHTNTISSGTSYFLHDGAQVPTTFSGITDGYKMFYTPNSVVSSGTFTITAHVENTVSGVLEQAFYLLYGYNMLFDELVDWGPDRQVDIVAQATNEVFCPNTEGESFWFQTADLSAVNLGATIRAVESVNLGAIIYPQSTTFFYGKTFTIIVSGVKDFSNNIMDPYIFTFTIEDPTT